MLKLVCSYSRKGKADEEFSSRQYHAGLEQELPDGLTVTQINSKVHETFKQLQAAVEAELSGVAGKAQKEQTTDSFRAENHPNGNKRKITNSQAKFALDIARRNNLGLEDLDQIIKDEFGAPGLYDLTAAQGSQLIDRLKVRKAA